MISNYCIEEELSREISEVFLYEGGEGVKACL